MKKQIKVMEDNGKQLVKSDEPIKKDFNIGRESLRLEEQKQYLMNLLKKCLLNLKV